MSEDRAHIAKATDDQFAGAALPSAIGVPGQGSRRETEHRPHSGKFLAVRVSLMALAVAALAAAGVIALRPGSTHTVSAPWSTWSPADNGLQGAQDIADYVAPYYRATPSQQLAVVTAVNLNASSNPLQVVIPTSSSGTTTTAAGGSGGSAISFEPLPASSTVVYNLCGTGTGNCSIGIGTPSAAGLLLLRREALELALYTFRYISGTQTVVAILPPGRTKQGCTGICPKPQSTTSFKPVNLAVAFDRQEVSQLLGRPLRATLPEDIPPTVAQMPTAPEAELVSVVTARGTFSEHVEQGQDGSTVVVLSPMPPS